MSGRRRSRMPAPPPAEAWVRAGARWECPACGKQYPRRGQGHSCVVVTLDEHFASRPRARELFDALRAAIEDAGGPVRLSIAKSRIGFINGITFAAAMPRQRSLRAHFVLLRELDSPRFIKVEHVPPWWVHTVSLDDPSQLDAELRVWLRESRQLGRRP